MKIAPIMSPAIPRAAMRVSNPAISPSPPKNSGLLTRIAALGIARQQSGNQPEPAKEFRADDQECHRSGHSHVGKGSHGGVKAKSSKPAQHFLRAMREEHHSQNQPQDGKAHILARSHQPLQHISSWRDAAVSRYSAIAVITEV